MNRSNALKRMPDCSQRHAVGSVDRVRQASSNLNGLLVQQSDEA